MNSKELQEIILKIEQSIRTGVFMDVEKTKIELKDLSTGKEWISLKETICAFLNSDGGIVICGVRERNKQYKFTSFNRNNESRVIDLQSKFFKNDRDELVDLSENIFFDYEPFLTGDILILYVYPLSEDLKYVKFNGEYYERKLTQDKIISERRLRKQKEYKTELAYAKELEVVNNAIITDLSVDKINKYIELLNKGVKKETLKTDLKKAIPFLSNKYFIKNEQVTTLGMLVCGEDPFHFLHNRSEVMCFYDTSFEISRDKKILRNDVISLMENTLTYVWSYILINRTYKNGGSGVPEYPENIIREMINNALAHRDYRINDFVAITVEPGKHIQIKNPGTFKEKMKILNTDTTIPIRRLKPGIPESKNPKLASVLKVFDKIEGSGKGMAALVNTTLNNEINLPYYRLRESTITLTIPSGKLLDEPTLIWLDGFNTYITNKLQTELTNDFKKVLAYFYKSELLNRRRCYTILLSDANNHFNVLDKLKASGLLSEHTASTEETPIYILDSVLMKTDFTDELIDLIGKSYIHYEQTLRTILNTLFRYGKYNHQALKASEITAKIYSALYNKDSVPKTYESLGRKVRKVCRELEKQGILNRDPKKAYAINFDYKKN